MGIQSSISALLYVRHKYIRFMIALGVCISGLCVWFISPTINTQGGPLRPCTSIDVCANDTSLQKRWCHSLPPTQTKPSWFWLRTMKTGSRTMAVGFNKMKTTHKLTPHGQAGTSAMPIDCAEMVGSFDFHPRIDQHVGFFQCAADLLKHNHTFIFIMVLRDPLTRVYSAYKHGMSYGVARGSKNDYAHINPMCRTATSFELYLTHCPESTDNHYLQMLDPLHMNITTALAVLDHVVVGIFEDFAKSLHHISKALRQPFDTFVDASKRIPNIGFNKPKPNSTLTPTGHVLLAERIKYDKILYTRAKAIFEYQTSLCLT
jgi:hypothetical protein